MKKHFILLGCVVLTATQPSLLYANEEEKKTKRLELGLEYTTELQTDFRNANWVNHLQLSADLSLPYSFSLSAKTISVARTKGDRILDDMQVFSNIDETNLTLALSVLGLGWSSPGGNTELFVGVRNLGEDYFVSPATSLFTGSSYGIFPTISANYDIASYPYASLGIDYKQRWGNWLLQASIYNGQGYNRFAGRDNVFRFCPKSDGVLAITALNYELNNSHYTVGCALFNSQPDADAVADQEGSLSIASKKRFAIPETSAKVHRQTRCAPWVNVEQRLGNRFTLLAQGSVEFGPQPACKHYEALGVVAEFGRTETGLGITHAHYDKGNETDMELTCKIPLSSIIYLQPACHLIRTGGTVHCVTMLRMGFTLGN